MRKSAIITMFLLLLSVAFLIACGSGDDNSNDDNTDGDIVDGDVVFNTITDGDVTDGDETDGDVTDGDVVDGDVADGDVTDGDEDDVDVDPDVPEFEDPPSLENCWHHPEMVPVGGRFCIDKWEAIAMEKPNCTGMQYGIFKNDYPEGFNQCVECKVDNLCPGDLCTNSASGDDGGPQRTPVYACSKKGVTPSTYISWFQARKACLNSGKEPCGYLDWVEACEGPDKNAYPYGNEYIFGTCYDVSALGENELEHPKPKPTGGRPDCVSDYGAYDMGGNVREWAQEQDASYGELLLGGDIIEATEENFESHLCDRPDPVVSQGDSQHIMNGFRCCKYSE